MLLLLWSLYLFVGGVRSRISDYYSYGSNTNNDNLDWMSRIPNSESIRNLSIPGTHNSLSFHGGILAQCQSLPLSEQFKAGIRFLDVRCHHGTDGLPIYHGVMYQQTDFDAVLYDTVQFLEAHPHEVIFMRIKEESASSDTTQLMLTSVGQHIMQYPSHRFWNSVDWPTLREARGKIVILQNFDTRYHMFVPYSSLAIDDHWNVAGVSRKHLLAKWRHVKANLKKSATNVDSDPRIHLTYSSGSSFMAFPYSVSKRLNKHLWKFFRKEKWTGQKAFGIIGMDFPGDALINQIIDSNFN